MSDLYIIAAGKGSRMGGNLPKALVPISDNEPNLTTTLKQVGHYFKNVFVVTNRMIQDKWGPYFDSLGALGANVINVPIDSGLGDGHAVLEGFVQSVHHDNHADSDDIVVCWGDVFIQHSEIISELLGHNMRNCNGLVPAVREDNPYVTLLVDNHMNCSSADFSKYGENHPSGFHDQSIFRFKKRVLWDTLAKLHTAFWKGGRYIAPGGELSLLYAFHTLYNIKRAVRVYETEYPTLSFNTPQEVVEIQEEINKKWAAANAPQ